MTIHVTWEGILAAVGGTVVVVFLLYLLSGIIILWRYKK